MILSFNAEEVEMLREEQIAVIEDKEYSEDEALVILEKLYAIEAMYSDLPSGDPRGAKANAFAKLADKLSEMIPEE